MHGNNIPFTWWEAQTARMTFEDGHTLFKVFKIHTLQFSSLYMLCSRPYACIKKQGIWKQLLQLAVSIKQVHKELLHLKCYKLKMFLVSREKALHTTSYAHMVTSKHSTQIFIYQMSSSYNLRWVKMSSVDFTCVQYLAISNKQTNTLGKFSK